jgi:hypothetical protein
MTKRRRPSWARGGQGVESVLKRWDDKKDLVDETADKMGDAMPSECDAVLRFLLGLSDWGATVSGGIENGWCQCFPRIRMIPELPWRCIRGRDGEVSGEGENWGGALDLRRFVGGPTCTPDSSMGSRFLSPDPFREPPGRFLPLSSVAWSWLPSPWSFGVSTAPPFSGLGVVNDLFLPLTSIASGWTNTDLRSSRTLST